MIFTSITFYESSKKNLDFSQKFNLKLKNETQTTKKCMNINLDHKCLNMNHVNCLFQ